MHPNKLKHQNDIDKYSSGDCPPKEAIMQELPAYRYVSDPIQEDDFKTHVQLGLLPKQTEPEHNKCLRCGLSLFNTIQNARAKYNALPKKSNFKYTHIAQGKILKEHGLTTTPEKKYGHFTLYEFEGVEVKAVFTLADKI